MSKTITFNQLKQEIEKYRKGRWISDYELTKEQKEFISLCREPEDKVKGKVSYDKMCKLWEQAGWGKISKDALRKYNERMKEGK